MKKILVVDDEQDIIELVKNRLEANHYSVISAVDGEEAIIKTQEHKPDLIILDVMMPKLNGYDVCDHLKFDEQYKHIPIILLTSRKQELEPQVSQMRGISYLQKPLDSEALLSTIKKALPKPWWSVIFRK